MPRSRLVHVASPVTDRNGHLNVIPAISLTTGKPKRRYRRRKVCTVPKLVMLSDADERRMHALAAAWGTSASGAIKQALEMAMVSLSNHAEESPPGESKEQGA